MLVFQFCQDGYKVRKRKLSTAFRGCSRRRRCPSENSSKLQMSLRRLCAKRKRFESDFGNKFAKMCTCMVGEVCLWKSLRYVVYWRIKLRTERSFLKIRLMSGSLQKPFSEGSRPLGTKATRKSVKGKLVLQRFHLPAKGCSKSQVARKRQAGDRGLQDIGDWTLSKHFRNSILWRKCDAWQWPLNKQTNKHVVYCVVVVDDPRVVVRGRAVGGDGGHRAGEDEERRPQVHRRDRVWP